MRQSPGGPGAPGGARPDSRVPNSRVHVSSISEPFAGRDAQLGQIFVNMRRAMNVSRETIARRLATYPSTIEDFEVGALTALPHWKETERIVRGYCELLRLDPQPILWRIRSHLEALANGAKAPPVRRPQPQPHTGGLRQNGMPTSVVRSERTRDTGRQEPPERRRRVGALVAVTAPIVLIAGFVYSAHAFPQMVYPAIAMLPHQVEVPVRAGLEYLVTLTATRRDGLRWIDVSDPQLRKGDKLQTGSR